MAERSTPVRSVVGVNCVVTCGVGVAWVCLVGSVCALISAPGCVFCASTVTDWGAACTVTPLPIPDWEACVEACARLASEPPSARRLSALGQRAAKRGRVHGSVGLGNDGADLGQAGVVEHEGLVLGRYAIENTVRLGARQQAALRIHGQAGDVRLAGIVIQLARARGRD